MRIEGRKKLGLIAGTVAAVLIGSGIAVAFWTTTGTGTGSASVGTTQNVTITQDGTVTGLFPDGPAQGIDFTITNPNPAAVRITTVTIGILSVTKDPGAPAGTCTAADFDIVSSNLSQDIPPGATAFLSTTTGAQIQMIDTGVNQDACKNATVALSFTTP